MPSVLALCVEHLLNSANDSKQCDFDGFLTNELRFEEEPWCMDVVSSSGARECILKLYGGLVVDEEVMEIMLCAVAGLSS